MTKYSDTYKKSCIKDNIKPDQEFIVWIDEIENRIFKKFALYLDDIPDEPYMINFEQKVSINKMVETITKSLMEHLSLFL